MAPFMGAGTSRACSAASERGRAKNVTPKAFTKQVTARAPVMARATTAKANRMRMKMSPSMAAPMSPWYVNHSDTNPLSGGMAEMASDPTRKHRAVTGIRRARPPRTSMLRVPVACSTLPAPRNKSPLNMAWFTRW